MTGGPGPLGMLTAERAVKRLARRTVWSVEEWAPAVAKLGEHVQPELVEQLIVRGCSPAQLERLASFTEEELRASTRRVAPNRAARRGR